ncbi:unnamed protein product [Candidula unifasciata]|uniref:Fe2OG dioxygenase domain-containing protein n=1 Tax=Candidula unifasciata TaxID=100452 RepID=A0A8S3Z0D1_9EUPU|nr:unnamed protein product [Candidula unifasciata]
MSGPRVCGCKGIRSCRLCMATNAQEAGPRLGGVSRDVLSCIHNASSEDELPVESFPEESQQLNTSVHPEAGPRLGWVSRDVSSCSHNASHKIDFEGIVIIEDFVSEAEEADLDRAIAGTHFVNSQSGRRKQDFGPKVNFKKQKVRTANFTGLPSYSQFLYQRMKAHPHLSDFEPVELCNLEYCQSRGAHIDPHLDDDWLWGERLVTLNLLSDSVLTFTLDSVPDIEVRVPLLRRSLIVVAAAARYSWKHSILPGDVVGRRIAMTFRELSKEFRSGGSRGQQGVELLKLALTFSGSAVSS